MYVREVLNVNADCVLRASWPCRRQNCSDPPLPVACTACPLLRSLASAQQAPPRPRNERKISKGRALVSETQSPNPQPDALFGPWCHVTNISIPCGECTSNPSLLGFYHSFGLSFVTFFQAALPHVVELVRPVTLPRVKRHNRQPRLTRALLSDRRPGHKLCGNDRYVTGLGEEDATSASHILESS